LFNSSSRLSTFFSFFLPSLSFLAPATLIASLLLSLSITSKSTLISTFYATTGLLYVCFYALSSDKVTAFSGISSLTATSLTSSLPFFFFFFPSSTSAVYSATTGLTSSTGVSTTFSSTFTSTS